MKFLYDFYKGNYHYYENINTATLLFSTYLYDSAAFFIQ